MTRPAQPGDRCIVIADPENRDLNIGKQVDCRQQCACDPGSWECRTVHDDCLAVLGPLAITCDPGSKLCFRKPHIIPLIDPDAPKSAVESSPRAVEHAR